jgi:ribosomal protein L35
MKQKHKTRSAATKRFRAVGKKGKRIKRGKAFRRHLLTKKTSKRKRQLRKNGYVAKCDLRRVANLIS